MSIVQSITYDTALARWLVVLNGITTGYTEYNWTVSHSSGFTGATPVFDVNQVYFKKGQYGTIIVVPGISRFYFALAYKGDVAPLSGTFTITISSTNGTASGSFTYNSVPVVPSAPGTATQAATVNPFNYSAHLDRVVVALETIAVSNAQTNVTMSRILNELTILSTNSQRIRELAESDGINFVGPYEWLTMSSLVKLYEEQGINLNELKAKMDEIPKSSAASSSPLPSVSKNVNSGFTL